MTRTLTPSGDQDGIMQALITDIIKGAKVKLVEPLINENKRLTELIEDLHQKDKQEFDEIKTRLEALEESVRIAPLTMLAAIKEAINYAGTVDTK